MVIESTSSRLIWDAKNNESFTKIYTIVDNQVVPAPVILENGDHVSMGKDVREQLPVFNQKPWVSLQSS